MKGKETRHVSAFKTSKLKAGESLVANLDGWTGEMMGSGDKKQRNGQLILTNLRVCFYRKGILGEVFEAIPVDKITSVETLSRLGYRVVRCHTSHDDLAFKTFEAKELFDEFCQRLEEARTLALKPALDLGSRDHSLSEGLVRLAQLKSDGFLSDSEFESAKARLLSD